MGRTRFLPIPHGADQLEPKLPPPLAARGEAGVLQAWPDPRRFALQVNSCLILGCLQEGQATLLKPGVALLLGPWNSMPRSCLSPMSLGGSEAGGRRGAGAAWKEGAQCCPVQGGHTSLAAGGRPAEHVLSAMMGRQGAALHLLSPAPGPQMGEQRAQ